MSNTDVPCCYFWDHRMLFLLAAMAYDRYVAIYDPLLYLVSMAPRVYVPLIIVSCVGGVLHASVHTVATFRLSFYGSNEIRHVFCDIPPLLDISCSDTHTNQLLLFYFAGSIEIVTVFFFFFFQQKRFIHAATNTFSSFIFFALKTQQVSILKFIQQFID